MSEWRPIETAPKDGTSVLVYDPFPWWSENEPIVFESWFDGRVWRISDQDNGTTIYPTHWMPLPEPPK